MKFENGDTYSGDWWDNGISGQGTMKYTNGDTIKEIGGTEKE